MFKKCIFSLFITTLIFNNASGMKRNLWSELKKKVFCPFNCADEDDKPMENLEPKEKRNSDPLYKELKKIMNYIDDQSINTPFNNGNTLLHLAIFYGYLDIVKGLLKETNIDINVKNDNNVTPILMALINGRQKMAAIMSKAFPSQTTPEQLEDDYEDITLDLDKETIIMIEHGMRFIKTMSLTKPAPHFDLFLEPRITIY